MLRAVAQLAHAIQGMHPGRHAMDARASPAVIATITINSNIAIRLPWAVAMLHGACSLRRR